MKKKKVVVKKRPPPPLVKRFRVKMGRKATKTVELVDPHKREAWTARGGPACLALGMYVFQRDDYVWGGSLAAWIRNLKLKTPGTKGVWVGRWGTGSDANFRVVDLDFIVSKKKRRIDAARRV